MTALQKQIIQTNSKTNDKTEKLQPSSSQNTCLCQNRQSQLVTTVEESEIVCRNCGVVFGFDEDYNSDNTIPYQHITKCKINLYQKRQKGGNPHDVKKITHISNLRVEKNNNTDIISFADICDKLKLSDSTSENCWKSYRDLKRRKTDKFTRAKTMCLAIYQTCRDRGIPFDENKTRNIVCQSLGVKKAPMLKSIIFKTGKEEKYHTEPNNREAFYLNLHLSQAQKDHDIEDITILRRIAARYYETLVNPPSSLKNNGLSLVMRNNNSDYNTLAKRAVTLAIQRCIRQ